MTSLPEPITIPGPDMKSRSSAVSVICRPLPSKESAPAMMAGTLSLEGNGRQITLTADDLDFMSGPGMVIGSGKLVIQAASTAWNYYLGTAAETAAGTDVARDFYANSMDLTSRDLAALANGFESIQIGRRGTGNLMVLGD